MRIIASVVSAVLLMGLVAAPPPPRRNELDKNEAEVKEKEELEDFNVEYNRYLREVVDLLESDPEFRRKLEATQGADIRSGKIASELEFVDHRVRNKLDEAKRQEIERLRQLAQKQYELTNGIETEHVKVSSEHLDHANPHTFEMEDLKKLIAKVSADLNAADEKRRQEFKEYEMQKEFEKQQKLKYLQGSEREKFEKQLKENETKHKQHEALHHPGSRQQLEEVWEKQDHMDNQEFDPKVFFQLHDLDGNGFWDQTEVKTLFLKELDKMYESKAPEDDMKERAEEMERMREHVFSEADKDKDGLISYDEFIEKTKQPDFEKDSGWESLDQKPAFTQEEYMEFEKRRMEEVQRMIQQGLIPPQPVFHAAQGYHPQVQYPQYHQYQGYQYPAGGQQPVRYAQDYPNPPSQHGYPQQGVNNQHYQGNQYHQQQQQAYQQPQAHPNIQANQQIYQQQPQAHPNVQGNQQIYQQQQSQVHQQQQPQVHQQQQPQVHQQQQPQVHQHQQPQVNQPQQPQVHQPQQPQIHQQQPQIHQQQPQVPPNQPASYQQGQIYEQHDPNAIVPDLKHRDTGNNHPNVIDLQQKKSEDHQSKSN